MQVKDYIELIGEMVVEAKKLNYDKVSELWGNDDNGYTSSFIKNYPWDDSFDEVAYDLDKDTIEALYSDDKDFRKKADQFLNALMEVKKVFETIYEHKIDIPTDYNQKFIDDMYLFLEQSKEDLDSARAYYKLRGHNVIEQSNGRLALVMDDGMEITIDKNEIAYRTLLFNEDIGRDIEYNNPHDLSFDELWVNKINKILGTHYEVKSPINENVISITPIELLNDNKNTMTRGFDIAFKNENGNEEKKFLFAKDAKNYEESDFKLANVNFSSNNLDFLKTMINYWESQALSKVKVIDSKVIEIIDFVDFGEKKENIIQEKFVLKKEIPDEKLKELISLIENKVMDGLEITNKNIEETVVSFLNRNQLRFEQPYYYSYMKHNSNENSFQIEIVSPNDETMIETFKTIQEAEKRMKTINKSFCEDEKSFQKLSQKEEIPSTTERDVK